MIFWLKRVFLIPTYGLIVLFCPSLEVVFIVFFVHTVLYSWFALDATDMTRFNTKIQFLKTFQMSISQKKKM